jgi:hypothetical protein
MQEIGHERMRDGAYAWNVFHDRDDPGRFVETSLVHSLLELKYRSARDEGRRIDRGANGQVSEGAAETQLLRRVAAAASQASRRRARTRAAERPAAEDNHREATA